MMSLGGEVLYVMGLSFSLTHREPNVCHGKTDHFAGARKYFTGGNMKTQLGHKSQGLSGRAGIRLQ